MADPIIIQLGTPPAPIQITLEWVSTAGDGSGTGEDGQDGREVELRNSGTYIQWRYVGAASWTNLVALSAITGAAGANGTNGTNGTNGADGADGREVELQSAGGYIQWRYAGAVSWTNLVALSAITGPAGATGATGATGPANTLTIGTVTTLDAGSSATASIGGTAPNQTLNLGIPRGDTGTIGSIADNSVGAAKLAATGQYKIFGRFSSGAGAGQELSLDAVFTVDGSGVISLTENYATAAEVAALTWVKAVRTTDSSPRSTNTTLAADGVLKIPLGANQKVCFRASVFFVTNGTADFKWGHTSPAGHTAYYLTREGVAGGGAALTGILVDTAPNTAGIAMLGSGAAGHIWFEGTITNGSTAGDWDFTWAQNTSTAFDTIVLAGSYVEYFSC